MGQHFENGSTEAHALMHVDTHNDNNNIGLFAHWQMVYNSMSAAKQ